MQIIIAHLEIIVFFPQSLQFTLGLYQFLFSVKDCVLGVRFIHPQGLQLIIPVMQLRGEGLNVFILRLEVVLEVFELFV